MNGRPRKNLQLIFVLAAVVIMAAAAYTVANTNVDRNQRWKAAAEEAIDNRETFVLNGQVYSLTAFSDNAASGSRMHYFLCSVEGEESEIQLLPYYDYAWCCPAGKLLYTNGKRVGTLDVETGKKTVLMHMKNGTNAEIDGFADDYAVLHGILAEGEDVIGEGKYVLLNVVKGTYVETEIDCTDMANMYPIGIDGNSFFFYGASFTRKSNIYVPFYRYDLSSRKLEVVGEIETQTEDPEMSIKEAYLLKGQVYIVANDGSLLYMIPSYKTRKLELFGGEKVIRMAVYDGHLWILTHRLAGDEAAEFKTYQCEGRDVIRNNIPELIFSFIEEKNDDGELCSPNKLSVSQDAVVVTMSEWKKSYVYDMPLRPEEETETQTGDGS